MRVLLRLAGAALGETWGRCSSGLTQQRTLWWPGRRERSLRPSHRSYQGRRRALGTVSRAAAEMQYCTVHEDVLAASQNCASPTSACSMTGTSSGGNHPVEYIVFNDTFGTMLEVALASHEDGRPGGGAAARLPTRRGDAQCLRRSRQSPWHRRSCRSARQPAGRPGGRGATGRSVAASMVQRLQQPRLGSTGGRREHRPLGCKGGGLASLPRYTHAQLPGISSHMRRQISGRSTRRVQMSTEPCCCRCTGQRISVR